MLSSRFRVQTERLLQLPEWCIREAMTSIWYTVYLTDRKGRVTSMPFSSIPVQCDQKYPKITRHQGWDSQTMLLSSFLNSCFSGHVHIRAPMPYPWPTAHCTQLSLWFMSPDFTAKLRMSPRRPLDMTWHDHYDLARATNTPPCTDRLFRAEYSSPSMSESCLGLFP